MRLLTSLLIAAGACSAQEQANIISSIGNLVSSKRNLALAVGGKVAHFVTAREADRQGKRVKISDQAENTAKYVVWRYAIQDAGPPQAHQARVASRGRVYRPWRGGLQVRRSLARRAPLLPKRTNC